MPIERITFTGADDITRVSEMAGISCAFPHVEWGILVSSLTGPRKTRFPSLNWRNQLSDAVKASDGRMRVSAHLCGEAAQSALLGRDPCEHVGNLFRVCERYQINFKYHSQKIFAPAVASMAKALAQTVIVQMSDNSNSDLCDGLFICGAKFDVLWDYSGGRGVTPEHWPRRMLNARMNGYAGGLTPSNLAQEIHKIESAADMYYNVDMETGVRSKSSTGDEFSLNACQAVCVALQDRIATPKQRADSGRTFA